MRREHGLQSLGRRIFATFIIAAFMAAAMNCPVFAKVRTTDKDSAGSAVYIAGNPDLYPVEYYDYEINEYRGIMPELYKLISEETGADFAYIQAGRTNRQRYLLENSQAELISAHRKGGIKGGISDFKVLTCEIDGKKTDIYIAFSKAASRSQIKMIKDAFEAISSDEIAAAAVKAAQERGTQGVSPVYVLITALLAMAVIVMLIIMVRHRHRDERKNMEKYIDEVTGKGNALYFEEKYKEDITSDVSSLYYIAYVAVDAQMIENYKGSADVEAMMRHSASVLEEFTGDEDFFGCVNKGAFAIGFQAPTEERALTWMEDVVYEMNSYDGGSMSALSVAFRAGIYHIGGREILADTALTNAKLSYAYAEKDRQAARLCDDGILKSEAMKSRIQRRMQEAISKKEFRPYLQLMYDVKQGGLCGAEVLSRWHSPEEGLLTPGRYIESMMNAGLVRKLDFSIFEECCRMLEEWKDTDLGGLKLSCNFTRLTMSDNAFARRMNEILEGTSFDRSRLVVELTEDSLADNMSVSIRNIAYCKELGFKVALDDFGSGFSSVNDLCEYPIDIIKLDQIIVSKASTERGLKLIRGIINLAHDIGLNVVCEGIETEEEKELMEELGCDFIQGFYFSRVLPPDAAEERLRRSKIVFAE